MLSGETESGRSLGSTSSSGRMGGVCKGNSWREKGVGSSRLGG